MNKIDKNELYKKLATVSVNSMIMSNTSKCDNCNSKLQEFSVFIGDSQRLSTLYNCCCSECLHIVVKNAIVEGKNDYEKTIKRYEDELLKQSLKIVRDNKLKNIEKL